MTNKTNSQSTSNQDKDIVELENHNLSKKTEPQIEESSLQTIEKVDMTKGLLNEIKKKKKSNIEVADKVTQKATFAEGMSNDHSAKSSVNSNGVESIILDANLNDCEIESEPTIPTSGDDQPTSIVEDSVEIEAEDFSHSSTANKKSKSKKKVIITLSITIFLVLIGTGVGIVMLSDILKPVETSVASEPTNPLTGEVITSSLPARPIVVSIDNAEGARPQSGISKADIVYEFPAEGNIPRLQGVFYSEFPERVAPIRSVRNSFVDLAREFKAIHVGFGVSPQANDYLKSGVVPFVNPNTYQDPNDDDMFWRDEARPSGVHNVYTNLNNIYAMDKNVEWKSPQIIRSYPRYKTNLSEEEKKKEAELLSTETSSSTINLSYISEEIEYIYNSENELYTRWVDGEVAVDFEDETPITTANVIVQFVSVGMLDEKRLDIDLTSGGQCLIFTKGKVFIGNWSRASLDDPTVFYREKKNEEGETYNEEIMLNVGKTWVQVINDIYTDEVLYL